MLKWFMLFTLSGVVVFAATLYFKLGGYKEAEIKYLENSHPLHLIYKDHIGPYHKINEVISEVESWAQSNNISCRQTFGEYIDLPGTIADDRLRSRGGCIVKPKDYQELPEGFFQKNIEARDYVYATFDGSPSIGPFKVYPDVLDWAQEQRVELHWPVIEIYNIISAERVKTEYLFPAKK